MLAVSSRYAEIRQREETYPLAGRAEFETGRLTPGLIQLSHAQVHQNDH